MRDAPEIGLVIRRAYPWWDEKRAGREEGSKDCPWVIVHIRQNALGETEVFIAPVTHTQPKPEALDGSPEADQEASRSSTSMMQPISIAESFYEHFAFEPSPGTPPKAPSTCR